MADAVILNYVDYETTKQLVESIRDYESLQHICIVDNASPNDSFEQLKKYSSHEDNIEVIQTEKNGGYGYGNNFGIRFLLDKYNSRYIILCNPDVSVENTVIEGLEDFLTNNTEYIIAAPFMLNKYGQRQNNTAFKIDSVYSYIMSFGLIYSKIFKPGEYRSIVMVSNNRMDVDAVAGSLFMFDAKKMKDYAMYDENIFLYCEERILGMKCKNAGFKIALLPQYTYVHNHSVSINKVIGNELSKRRILNRSAMYVIKNYYKANIIVCLFGRAMMEISIIEIIFIGLINSKRSTK